MYERDLAVTTDEHRALYWGAAGGALLTATLMTRFDGSLAVLFAAPLLIALSTMIAEGILRLKHGTTYGESPGLGLAGWFVLTGAMIALLFSFVT